MRVHRLASRGLHGRRRALPWHHHDGIAFVSDLHAGDARRGYTEWETPATIISDGAYGVRGFHGDTVDAESLPAWYLPHVRAWSQAASPATTLWFWANTEVGWASVHPLLVDNGWEYVETIIWDKGLAHIAGNVNGQTIRRFPVVTEVCALYQRKPVGPHGESMRAWLRSEWVRAGFPDEPTRLAGSGTPPRGSTLRRITFGTSLLATCERLPPTRTSTELRRAGRTSASMEKPCQPPSSGTGCATDGHISTV